jgi:phosphate transport system protein
MRIHLQRDLENLRRDLLGLAVSVEDAIRKAIRALSERKVRPAEEVIAAETAIDQEEKHIEEECFKMLALHQPVAIDLRRIAAALKINNEMERMADLAEEIAECALALVELPDIPISEKLQAMTDLTTMMVRKSLDAFFDLEADQARLVCRWDDEVDRHNREIVEELVPLMKHSPELVKPGLSLFSATRHLERIADHAANVAEAVVYLVEGTIIRHRQRAVHVGE